MLPGRTSSLQVSSNLLEPQSLEDLNIGYTSAWSPISKTQLAKADRIPNQALNIISGATAKTSGDPIQFYLGFYSMEQVYVRKMAKEYVKALTTPIHPLQEELAWYREVKPKKDSFHGYRLFFQNCGGNCSFWQHQKRIVGILQHSRPGGRLH